MSCENRGLRCPKKFGTDLGQTWDNSGQGLPVLLIFWDTWDRLSQKSHGTETPCLTQSKTLSLCPVFSVPIFGRDCGIAPCLSQSERVPRSVGTNSPCLTQSESGRACPTANRDSVAGGVRPPSWRGLGVLQLLELRLELFNRSLLAAVFHYCCTDRVQELGDRVVVFAG